MPSIYQTYAKHWTTGAPWWLVILVIDHLYYIIRIPKSTLEHKMSQ